MMLARAGGGQDPSSQPRAPSTSFRFPTYRLPRLQPYASTVADWLEFVKSKLLSPFFFCLGPFQVWRKGSHATLPSGASRGSFGYGPTLMKDRADGKGMVDDFDVEVRNENLDRTCLVDELSGGRFVLVNEAVNLGIAIYNMRQGEGVRYETLLRDESVGALDAFNGKEYVRMLRRAMDLGGFHQVIFICHMPLVWELADDILSVGAGCVATGEQQAASTEWG